MTTYILTFYVTLTYYTDYLLQYSSLDPSKIKAGDTVKLTCTAKSNPQQVSFKWYIDDILQYDKVKDDDLEDQNSTMELVGIDKSLNGKKVKCLASNKIQNALYESNKVHKLDVHCK